jgi:hypothetical protein
LKDELKGHDKTVTSIDIAPNSGRIVSCSQGNITALTMRYAQSTVGSQQLQIATPSYGNPLRRATSRRWSCCA